MLDNEADAQAIYTWEIESRPGARLCIGIPPGENRPAIWIVEDGVGAPILGRFNGPMHMLAVVNYLNAAFEEINRVISHYKKLNGDDDSANDWQKPKD